ncbi:hypothetical protein [Paraburkholderia sp. GAS348]|uniref:hypothetical protein n=1 Tax=Paraburkholderia sp. GAS348 TaxID=3035132 RepID=UPI003D1DAEEC
MNALSTSALKVAIVAMRDKSVLQGLLRAVRHEHITMHDLVSLTEQPAGIRRRMLIFLFWRSAWFARHHATCAATVFSLYDLPDTADTRAVFAFAKTTRSKPGSSLDDMQNELFLSARADRCAASDSTSPPLGC